MKIILKFDGKTFVPKMIKTLVFAFEKKKSFQISMISRFVLKMFENIWNHYLKIENENLFENENYLFGNDSPSAAPSPFT